MSRIAIPVQNDYFRVTRGTGNGATHRTIPDLIEAIEQAGGVAELVYPQARPDFGRYRGLLLPGGADRHPEYYGQAPGRDVDLSTIDRATDEFQLEWARYSLEVGLPTLGICRGMQLLNVAAGGTLVQDLRSAGFAAVDHAPQAVLENPALRANAAHWLQAEADSTLARSLGATRTRVNSIHHQAVDRVGASFKAVAWAEDGVIESIQHRDHPHLFGVQFHPEDMRRQAGFRGLFSALLAG